MATRPGSDRRRTASSTVDGGSDGGPATPRATSCIVSGDINMSMGSVSATGPCGPVIASLIAVRKRA